CRRRSLWAAGRTPWLGKSARAAAGRWGRTLGPGSAALSADLRSVSDGWILPQSGTQGGDLLGTSLQVDGSGPRGLVRVVVHLEYNHKDAYLRFIRQECYVDLLQRLDELSTGRLAQLIERFIRA
ncbi:hypothetical protein EGW08_017692, partial [Elysia chlorotica]